VFGALNTTGSTFMGSVGLSPLTLIFEFTLPAKTESVTLSWAESWHALGALSQGPDPYTIADEPYNRALQVLTDRVLSRGAMPDRPNGSALSALRVRDTNDDLREFILCPTTTDNQLPAPKGCTVLTGGIQKKYPFGVLVPHPISRTPNGGVDRSGLGDWVNHHADAVRRSDYEIDDTCPGEGVPATADCVPKDLYADFNTIWDMPNVASDLRHAFAVNTCNGCHDAETGSDRFQIAMREALKPLELSPFLAGGAKVIPFARRFKTFSEDNQLCPLFDPTARHFNELERRAADLRNIVCPLRCAVPVN
jgi:hypothetical protein